MRASKSSSGSSSSSSCQAGGSVPHKFSSIVNKVESLISKMHHDKVNNFKLLQQQQQEQQDRVGHQEGDQEQEQECKCASLDSLNNLTEDEEHEMLYTDSDDAEIAHITGTTAAQVHHAQQMQHQLQLRRSDLDQLTNESIRELNEQCCASLAMHHGGDPTGSSSGQGLSGDNAWSVEEDMVYKCCTTATLTSTSSAGSLCEQCCLEEQLSYKLSCSQRDDNNNNHEEEQEQQLEQEQEEEEPQPVMESGPSAAALIPAPSGLLPTPSSVLLMGGNKTRRVSNASSGSVSRMETILEEPTESKISVKEILARFETMNSHEVKGKEEVFIGEVGYMFRFFSLFSI